tara:strand:- start:6764 stop:8182 length:1419 start_codon:yes stop_codon:yes gene_type:complete
MANIFPAIQAQMGRWEYFITRMSMKDVTTNVRFAHDIHDDPTLDVGLQRVLNESRAKGEIATYLSGHDDRFFGSIVIAALGGDPQFMPVDMAEVPELKLLAMNESIRESWGVLQFTGEQTYYALDGQHRLSAITELLDPASDLHLTMPEGFENEQLSVLLVIPGEVEAPQDFLVRYRRLFGHLNRNAKPMKLADVIITDEDDIFAIITRRLITEHSFFQAPGRQRDSIRVKMNPGKNLTPNDSYVISLEGLYEMNIELLTYPERVNSGWFGDPNLTKIKDAIRFRPDEDVIDEYYQELTNKWDAIVETLPILSRNPNEMRQHDKGRVEDGGEPGELQSCVLFWPVVQNNILAKLVSRLATRAGVHDASKTRIKNALAPLQKIDWDAHAAPWFRHLLVPRNAEESSWAIASEERKKRVDSLYEVLSWVVGLLDYDEEAVDDMRSRCWSFFLEGDYSASDEEAMWQEVEDARVG